MMPVQNDYLFIRFEVNKIIYFWKCHSYSFKNNRKKINRRKISIALKEKFESLRRCFLSVRFVNCLEHLFLLKHTAVSFIASISAIKYAVTVFFVCEFAPHTSKFPSKISLKTQIKL